VEFLIGRGGMGDVYRAVDTRLERPVAIKVLRAHFSERFLGEAKALSALNHPHVCTLLDVGPNFLVMELLEGETLEGRIKRGPLSLMETCRLGAQIAEAVAFAHEHHVTHRDLKPANVMLTRSGVKVLDFGLAATQGQSVMQTGVVMGTPAYMAPERQQGRDAGPRTDIYALGLILHEMITTRRPVLFDGRIALSELPQEIAHIVARCLEESPEARWQSALEVRALLEWAAATPRAVPAISRRTWLWAALSAVGGVAAGSLWKSRSTASNADTASSALLDLSIPPPEDTTFRVAKNLDGGFALSPDGTMLAFVGRTNGVANLWIRRLDAHQARMLPGTEHAYEPFWSPDSKSIGFLTTSPSELKRIDAAGGGPRTLVTFHGRVPGGFSSWGSDTIVFRTADLDSLQGIPENGGEPSAVVDGKGLASPSFLPDGRHFLYRAGGREKPLGPLMLSALGSMTPPSELGEAGDRPQYSAGHILSFMNERLMAQPFDLQSLRLTSDPFPVAEIAHVLFGTNGYRYNFSTTPSGMLVYPTMDHVMKKLIWRDRQGRRLREISPAGLYDGARISPDGKRIAYALRERGNTDLWVADLDNLSPVRLTFGASVEQYPVWSPDGQHLVFISDAAGWIRDIYRQPVSGGQAKRLTRSQYQAMTLDWSGDGKFVLCMYINVAGRTMILPSEGGEAYEFISGQTGFHAQFSPGTPRWIAYSSDDTGRWEVFVQRFVPGLPAGARIQISREGGKAPRWRSDGKELFFVTRRGELMALDVDASKEEFVFSPPKLLFTTEAPEERSGWFTYDVSSDGQRFLLVEPAKEPQSLPLTLVTNWLALASR
jgi:serine/threonine protein kinase